ncbi:hypothetical protein PILCRDRAFT_823190 [Piloderma croceum F 1598]|uniref:Uncharacterized protein n=1 Tax=Piloderma croceum (strain F 1598) TaxID=765440 RepID=A0A0C3FJM6_PILCF|nr:hypothetical protein PILCRDRAFT_823190 [Piloderma croceum F 1598]
MIHHRKLGLPRSIEREYTSRVVFVVAVKDVHVMTMLEIVALWMLVSLDVQLVPPK